MCVGVESPLGGRPPDHLSLSFDLRSHSSHDRPTSALLVSSDFLASSASRYITLPTAERHRLALQPRVHLGVHAAEHGLLDILADDHRAVAAHQRRGVGAQRLGQRLPSSGVRTSMSVAPPAALWISNTGTPGPRNELM